MNMVEGSTTKASRRREKAPKVDLRAPRVAWWTLLLFVGCWVGWLGGYWLSVSGWVPVWLGVTLMGISAFGVFTPMHDASHKSVARAKWVNELVGRLSVLLLLAPFVAFRYMHLEHHKHTNDEHKDPDMWSGRGPKWLLPFRWVTQDLHYYALYLQRWRSRPVAERWETVLTLVVLGCLLGTLSWLGWWREVLLYWVLPSRIAIGLLAYSFDYLPHKPHVITSSEDRYKATLVRPHWLLTPVMLYQNFHLIHHLYPGVPFYRYASIWRTQKDFLLRQGVEMRSLTGQVISPTIEEEPHTH